MEKELPQSHMVPWVYDFIEWIFSLSIDIFFREVYPRNAWRVPKKGPVLIIAAPHANQFVDSAILMRILKCYAGRRVSFLIAAKSLREPYIGPLAKAVGSLPVERAQDNVKPGIGKIYLPDPDNDPTIVRGKDTDFTSSMFMVGGNIILPRIEKESPDQQTIAEIIGPDKLRLSKPFKQFDSDHPLHKGLREGTSFKVAPHINQARMFQAVFHDLSAGGCIGIFPEGGSHDRTNLLPLKAGAALIALGALAQDPECGLSIVPCGMNYFHPNKFRSRAVIEFGNPIQVGTDQIEAYKAGGVDKRNAVGSLLETIYEGLEAVTQLSPDHETLMLIQATRRLYKPLRLKLPLPMVIELNRRLLKAYTQLKDEPQVQELIKAVTNYNRRLRALGVKDHQVEWGNVEKRPWWLVLVILLYRIGELLTLSIGTLPSLAMSWPVFVTAKVISVKKQRKALAGSVVKLKGRDVVGTWKILVAMGLAPALYTWYTVIVTLWLHYCRNNGYYSTIVPWYLNGRTYIPDSIPLSLYSLFFFGLMISVTFAGLRIGEIGLDVLKSLPPLFVALNPRSADTLVKLRAHRQALSAKVIDTIDTFGPEIFPDFESERLLLDTHQDEDVYQSQMKDMGLSWASSPNGRRSRSRSAGRGLRSEDGDIKGLSSSREDGANGDNNLSEVKKRVRDAMRESERGRAGPCSDE